MKNLRTILCLIFTIILVACNNEENFDSPVGTLMSRESAYTQVKKEISALSLKDIDIWASKEPIPAKTTIIYGGNEFVSPDIEAWCFFIDELPMGDWAHPCQYIFVDANHQIHTKKAYFFPYTLEEDYELINISDTRKNFNEEIIKPKGKSMKSRVASSTNHYAIIISGGYNQSNNHIRYWNNCSYIYQTLTDLYGYSSSNIYVLMADGTNPAIDNSLNESSVLDLDGDGICDIDYPATISSLQNVISTLSSQMTNEDYLFIYTTDHGNYIENIEESVICMWNQELLSASTFSNMVRSLNAKAINIVMGQCYSGGFIEHFNTISNLCISTSCKKDELTWTYGNTGYTEYLYNWTRSHELAGTNSSLGNFISAIDSHTYAVDNNSFINKPQTPQHYSSGDLSEKLALSGLMDYNDYIDGYCTIDNYRYSFYADEPNHEPEFGIACGDKIDITLTNPNVSSTIFSWNIVENMNYAAIFVPNNTYAHLEVGTQSPVGQRIRIKVDANIPIYDYSISQYLNFYITSNYRIARSGSDILSIESTNADDSSTTYVLNSSASTFTYQIMDEGTNHVRMSGSYSKSQKLDLDISQLPSGVYTLIIRENREIKANQRLTI